MHMHVSSRGAEAEQMETCRPKESKYMMPFALHTGTELSFFLLDHIALLKRRRRPMTAHCHLCSDVYVVSCRKATGSHASRDSL